VDGIVSYVRGKRVDIDDDLFRIAPLNAVVDLSYRRERWSAAVEGVFYAAQEEVSTTNGEEESPGYALLNLYGQYTFPKQGLTLSAGIENVLDKTYRPHLNGINRVLNSDVAVGERIPGDGINGFVQARFTW
jgi:iron complex outermembrane receptor protein